MIFNEALKLVERNEENEVLASGESQDGLFFLVTRLMQKVLNTMVNEPGYGVDEWVWI